MNEINRLWDKWAKDHSPTDVDEIIAYFRKQLQMYDAGVKPKRADVEQIDMSKILQNIKTRQGTTKPADKPTVKTKGLRRI